MKPHTPQEIGTMRREADSNPDSVANWCRRVAVPAQLTFKRAWRLWKQQGFALQPPRDGIAKRRPLHAQVGRRG